MSQPPRTQTRHANTASTPATSGSQIVVQTESGPSHTPSATLRLRGAEPVPTRRIQWAEDVIDNEGMGKKSSKVCCIYHKPHEPGDSDSEDSDSNSSDSDGEPDLSRAQRAGGNDRKGRRGQGRDGDNKDNSGKGKGKESERKPSPNAYERQPKNKSTKAG